MTQTPNHNYNTPSEGTANWHLPLNENFEQIDLDIEIRGKEADTVDYEPKVGAKYEATDTGAIYYGDGETWVLVDRCIDELHAENIAATQIQGNGPLIVSPSIRAGYDSLQNALDDAAEGKSREIRIAEDIQENILIPRSKTGDRWYTRGGLKIKGINGKETKIKDNLKDGTPIMKVEKAGLPKLSLENLTVQPDGVDTRAFSQARYEEDTNGALQLAHFSNCRFEAPVIVSKVFHSYFENCVFRPYVGTERYGEKIYPGFMLNAGNQYMFDRCHFVDATGEVKYGTCWLSGANSGLFNSCFFSATTAGWDEESDRPTAPLLIDTGGDMIFNLPYVERSMDYGMVTDAIEGGGNAIDNIRINGSRIGSIKINNRVKGFVVDGAYRELKINVNNGIAEEGSWVRSSSSDIEVTGQYKRFLRVINRRPQGWSIETPPLPVDGHAIRRNDFSCPVLVYQSGAEGTEVKDFTTDKWRQIPDDSGPIFLGLNEKIKHEVYPNEWEWYGME